MFQVGDIISYNDMCREEGTTLQHGMNFRLRGGHSVILMSVRPNAPYADKIEDGGRVIIYEGHDIPRTRSGPDPKAVDQPMQNPGGTLSRNGKFFEAARSVAVGLGPEFVRVYEKIRPNIWSYNGLFHLTDARIEKCGNRKVFKFRLEIVESHLESVQKITEDLPHDRVIPSHVKLEVWKRDGGQCTKCGSVDNLHFDHILPFSKGGSSLVAANIQLLCARHNILKKDKIE